MGYLVPLKFVKVSNKRSDNRQFDVAICATRIVAIMSTEISQARKTISNERQAGTLINASCGAKAKSAICLDNGSVIVSPLTVQRIMSIIEKTDTPDAYKRQNVRVYDTEVAEPTEEDEEYIEDDEYDDLDF